MEQVKNTVFTDERSLFKSCDLHISDCTFDKGESPLKECKSLDVASTLFKWKYPLWYCRGVKLNGCTLYEGARAGIWYTSDIEINDTFIQAPKTFRRSENVSLNNVVISRADETLWSCRKVKMKNVTARGDYFFMNSSDIEVDGLTLDGNYSFDGTKNVVIKNSRLLTKDAFWNSENVTVYDSFISGEYLGWNSKNVTLVNCTIESLQGMCYVDGLKLINCKLQDTSLAFEYSTVDAEISGGVHSVLNPNGGTIKADFIGNLIIDKNNCAPGITKIVCDDVRRRSDHITWEEDL